MQFPLRLFLFSALLTTGACLQCEFCNATGTTCTGETRPCSSGENTCVIAVIENGLGTEEKKEVTVLKRCESLERCMSPTIQLSVGNGTTYRAGVACCLEGECHKAAPELPVIQPKPNGRICPACFVEGDVCGNEIVACTGLEKFCFEVTSVFYVDGKEQDRIMKGCTTQSVCSALKTGNSPMLDVDIVKEVKCNPLVSKGFQSACQLLPPFSALLLLKIFL